MVPSGIREFEQILSEGADRIDLWAQIIGSRRAKVLAEVGVWKGEFARQILRRCDSVERYYMIDPWAHLEDWDKPFNVDQKTFDDIYIEAMHNTSFASSKTVVLRGTTKEVLDDIADESVDFAYVDGDHTLRGITIDLIRLLPKMKEGGLIGGDDFVTDPWATHGSGYAPTFVCPFSIYFAEAVDVPIWALPFNQFLIEKRSAGKFAFVDTIGTYADVSLSGPLTPGLRRRIGTRIRRLLSRISLRG